MSRDPNYNRRLAARIYLDETDPDAWSCTSMGATLHDWAQVGTEFRPSAEQCFWCGVERCYAGQHLGRDNRCKHGQHHRADHIDSLGHRWSLGDPHPRDEESVSG